MKTYKVIQESPISNQIVKEVNAAVCGATFKNAFGVQFAELFTCPNSSDVLIGIGTCAPIHSTFVDVVKIDFGMPKYQHINTLIGKAIKAGFEEYGNFNEGEYQHCILTAAKGGDYDGETIDIYYNFYSGEVDRVEYGTQFPENHPHYKTPAFRFNINY